MPCTRAPWAHIEMRKEMSHFFPLSPDFPQLVSLIRPYRPKVTEWGMICSHFLLLQWLRWDSYITVSSSSQDWHLCPSWLDLGHLRQCSNRGAHRISGPSHCCSSPGRLVCNNAQGEREGRFPYSCREHHWQTGRLTESPRANVSCMSMWTVICVTDRRL